MSDIYIQYEAAQDKLKEINQEQILRFWNDLSDSQKHHLLEQINDLDIDVFKSQQNKLHEKETSVAFTPFQDFEIAGTKKDIAFGCELIAQGKVGCLIVAGGQGTRLRFDGPKGMYPISPIKHKSLFQLFAEKTVAAGKQANRLLPLAIMTSQDNHSQSVDFFQKNHFFGLQQNQVSFFMQNSLPLLDVKGNLFLERPDSLSQGPDGNGSVLHHFAIQGILQGWKAKGIEYINFIIVDNPLADPFDAELVGFHVRNHCDITVKCIERKSPEESVGLLVQTKDGVQVIEYTEMPEKERKEKLPNGALKHRCANISLFCFNLDFVQESVHIGELPWHLAFKAVTYVDQEGRIIKPQNPMAWKFEKFIFDVLPRAKKVNALLYPRERCFAPLKNETGESSPATVKQALMNYDRMVFENLTGTKVPDKEFELSQEFHYPTGAMVEKWKGRALPDEEYITP